MSRNDYPRLCGGTFFTLVLQALRQRTKPRQHSNGESDGLTDPEILVRLIQVVNPDYINPGKEVMKITTNNYKQCRVSSGVYLPFKDKLMIQTFDEHVKTNYGSVLTKMTDFTNTCLDLGDAVDRKTILVKALIDLIQQDQSIAENESFYIGEQGQRIKKSELGDMNMVCLPAFLLGIWHYVLVNRPNNTIGRATYEAWCPSNGGGTRDFSSNIGNSILSIIQVYIPGAGNQLLSNGMYANTRAISTRACNDSNAQTVDFHPCIKIDGAHEDELSLDLNFDCFNLFVINTEQYNNSFFLVPSDRALTKHTSQEIKTRFSPLSPESIEIVKSFPAIFCSENHHGKRTDPEHMAFYGYIKSIKVQDNGIKIKHQLLGCFPQQLLISYASEFAIDTRPYPELCTTHWAIKRINLLEALECAEESDRDTFKEFENNRRN